MDVPFDNWLDEPLSRLDEDDNDVSSELIFETIGRQTTVGWCIGVEVGKFGVEAMTPWCWLGGTWFVGQTEIMNEMIIMILKVESSWHLYVPKM